jgi:outer membrane protein TolC
MVGFTFEVPLGEHFERGQYRVANLQVGQLETSIQNLRLLIVQDVRNALRQIQTNWELVQTTHVNTDFRRRSLDAERRRYEVGTTTTFDLLQFENELAQAQASELSAIVDYRISLANLRRATGVLIAYNDVRLPVDP